MSDHAKKGLRKVDGIYYDLEIPELKKSIKYRPLKVKESKQLLTAIGMKDEAGIVNSILDIVEAATKSDNVDVRKLPSHLIDLIFMKIYIKSSGQKSQGQFNCAGTIKVPATEEVPEHDEPCGLSVNVDIDLSKAELKYPDDYKPAQIIDVGNGQMLKMRIPALEDFKRVNKIEKDATDAYIFAGMEAFIDGEDVKVPGIDFDLDELSAWLEELDSATMNKINEFYESVPYLALDVEVTCPKCKRKELFVLEGIEDFFV